MILSQAQKIALTQWGRKRIPGGKSFLNQRGGNIFGSAIPGAILSGVGTTLWTGNPIAGGAVAFGDLITSAAMGRLLASKNVFGGKYAGQMMPVIDPKSIKKVQKSGGAPGVYLSNPPKQSYYVGQKKPELRYNLSTPQSLAMGVTTIGAPLAIEPLFRGQQGNVQQQQLAQMKYLNGLNPTTAQGTMYQLQGVPMRAG